MGGPTHLLVVLHLGLHGCLCCGVRGRFRAAGEGAERRLGLCGGIRVSDAAGPGPLLLVIPVHQPTLICAEGRKGSWDERVRQGIER